MNVLVVLGGAFIVIGYIFHEELQDLFVAKAGPIPGTLHVGWIAVGLLTLVVLAVIYTIHDRIRKQKEDEYEMEDGGESVQLHTPHQHIVPNAMKHGSKAIVTWYGIPFTLIGAVFVHKVVLGAWPWWEYWQYSSMVILELVVLAWLAQLECSWKKNAVWSSVAVTAVLLVIVHVLGSGPTGLHGAGLQSVVTSLEGTNLVPFAPYLLAPLIGLFAWLSGVRLKRALLGTLLAAVALFLLLNPDVLNTIFTSLGDGELLKSYGEFLKKWVSNDFSSYVTFIMVLIFVIGLVGPPAWGGGNVIGTVVILLILGVIRYLLGI